MEKYPVGEAVLGEERIRYYLVQDSFNGNQVSYGIAVELGKEQVVIENLSNSDRRVRTLLSCMERGTVTPVSVPDIVEDWLAGA